ncbi:MAG: glycosyltransferase family 4 protein [Phycisphaerae bacterium]|nr:glycosyltransferase family 4 protein [Phycisphaerae bacterium]
MRVFMLGWEFPPHISGGLGTACHGMTKGLDEIGVEVTFVLPMAVPIAPASHVRLRTAAHLRASRAPTTAEATAQFRHVTLRQVDARLRAYSAPGVSPEVMRQLSAQLQASMGATATPEMIQALQAELAGAAQRLGSGAGAHYTGDLMAQVYRYARLALELSKNEPFDVVHAHDWMTYPAGLAVAAATKKPLVVHVHSTEFDRSGEHINQQVYDIERAGMHGADCVICVSHLTRSIVAARYGVPLEKLEVVYNAIDLPDEPDWEMKPIRQDEKIVLFLGRVTMQKGPEYFLRAAKKVLEKFTNVRFVMAGSGDMIARCIQEVAELRIGQYVTFTGFLRGDDVNRIFQMADLYVMPSVSEPFGIAPLEALSHNVPVIISKQSGVSEVLSHVLKVDFWDIDEMANKILAVLRYPPLHRTLRQHGHIELQKLSWRDSAQKLACIYGRVAG